MAPVALELPSAVVLLATSVPRVMVHGPVKVLLPERFQTPLLLLPVFVMVLLPLMVPA